MGPLHLDGGRDSYIMKSPVGRTDGNKARIDSFLNLYKASGPTSMDMVRQIKRLTGQRRKVGHGGTLDPLAEGVLPICFGQATRLMEFLVESEREYQLQVHLGVTTSTYDGEGEVVKRGDVSGLSQETVEQAIKSFQGIIYQTPPMYSALKIDGKRLYNLARSGMTVERQPRKVNILNIDILDIALPLLSLKVASGRGAYMRSLAHDLGESLGCGGYLSSLVRMRAGPFHVENAIPMSKMHEAGDPDSWKQYLKPADYVLLDMRSVVVSKAAERHIRSGQPVSLSPYFNVYASYMERCRAYTQDRRFLAVVCFDKPRNQWQPYKVLDLGTPSPYAPTPDNG